MITFVCPHFNAGRRFHADTRDEAAQRVADAVARRRFGRRSYGRTLRLDTWSADGSVSTWEATLGTDDGGVTIVDGRVRFTLTRA